MHLEAMKYRHGHPAQAVMYWRPLKYTQHFPALIQEFVENAEHV